MTIEAVCPRCQQSFALVNDLGQNVNQCPLCGFDAAPPAAAPLGVTMPLPAAAPDGTPSSADRSESRSGRHQEMLSVPRFVLYSQGAILAIVAIVAFVLGAGFGGLYSHDSARQSPPTGSCEIKGKISRIRTDGAEVGENALVIFLPAERNPDEKWPHHSLRPELDLPPTDHRALVGIRLLGGAYIRTDARGQYRVKVASPGEYYALVLAAPSRDPSESWNRRDLAQIGRYFQDAMGLLSDTDYRWQLLTVTPGERWDVAFQSP